MVWIKVAKLQVLVIDGGRHTNELLIVNLGIQAEVVSV
jgi:hypothetical protein